ncbi:hypothetical protein BKA69DRAFT_1174746 [Paraphysoderma sedebokerense]|nr:hypothetical protein BKA69DRAFT_1174746 [Paraphysoderma sedebokerense]
MPIYQQLVALLLFRIKLVFRSQKGMLIGLPLQMLLLLYIVRIIADAVILPEEQVEVYDFSKPPTFSIIGDPDKNRYISDLIPSEAFRDLKSYHNCFESTYYPLRRVRGCNVGCMIVDVTNLLGFLNDSLRTKNSDQVIVPYTLLQDDIRFDPGAGSKAEEIINGLENAVEQIAGDPPVIQEKINIQSLTYKFPTGETAHPVFINFLPFLIFPSFEWKLTNFHYSLIESKRFDHLSAQGPLLRILLSSVVATEFQVHGHIRGFQWEPVVRVIIPAIMWIFALPLSRFVSQTAAEIRSHYRYYFKLNGLSPTTFAISQSIVYTAAYFVIAVIASSFIFGMGPFRANAVFYVPFLLWWCFNCSLVALLLGEKWDGSGSSGYFFLLLLPWIGLRHFAASLLPQIVIYVLAAVWPQYSFAELFYAFVEAFIKQESLPLGQLVLIFLAQSALYCTVVGYILFKSISQQGRKKQAQKSYSKAIEGMSHPTINKDLQESVAQEVYNLSANPGDYSLRVLNLQHKYGSGNPILKGVSFGVKRNECLGFLGVNGAGKSTTINSLTGMINPTNGQAILNGVDMIPFGDKLIGKIGHKLWNRPYTSICTQHDILYQKMTVSDHLRLFCHVKQLPPTTHDQQIRNLLEDFNLTLMKDRIVGELSGGNRRKLTLALSCLSSPDIIFLDEPTTGIDIRARKMIWDVVLKMKQRCSIFLTSHSMDEISYLCDRICILKRGVISFIGSPHGFTYELLIQISPIASTQIIIDNVKDTLGEFQPDFVSRIGNMVTFYLNVKDEDLSRAVHIIGSFKSMQGFEEIVELGLGEANLKGLWIKEIGDK